MAVSFWGYQKPRYRLRVDGTVEIWMWDKWMPAGRFETKTRYTEWGNMVVEKRFVPRG